MPGMVAGSMNAQWIGLTSKVFSLARKPIVPFATARACDRVLGLEMPILKVRVMLNTTDDTTTENTIFLSNLNIGIF